MERTFADRHPACMWDLYLIESQYGKEIAYKYLVKWLHEPEYKGFIDVLPWEMQRFILDARK